MLIAASAAIGPRLPALFYTVLPLTGSAGPAVLSVSDSDATAATQLRPAGAYLALAVDLIADAAVVYPQLPNGEAIRDLCSATAIFSATTFLVQGQKASADRPTSCATRPPSTPSPAWSTAASSTKPPAPR